MKDEIDVSVRRSPKYGVFIALGAILGIIVSGVLTLFVDPAEIPAYSTVAKGAGLTFVFLAVVGGFLGAILALILDWRGRKKAKEYRVGAQIDIVDDPKEIARRRIAAAKGEPIDESSADQDEQPEITTVEAGAQNPQTARNPEATQPPGITRNSETRQNSAAVPNPETPANGEARGATEEISGTTASAADGDGHHGNGGFGRG